MISVRAEYDITHLGIRYVVSALHVKEVKSRYCKLPQPGKAVFNKKYTLFTYNINKHLRKQLLKTFVWNVLLYTNETWTLGFTEMKRIMAFEL